MIQLLFVCLGNICRSPAAEAIMNQLLEDTKMNHQIICDSVGLTTNFFGQPADKMMAEVATERGYPISSVSRPITPEDCDAADFILAMDNDILSELRLITNSTINTEKIQLICDFCEFHPDTEVPDPYSGEKDHFAFVIDLLEDACQGLLTQLKNRIN
jgi:protein-tyrosine phosphatase